MKYYKKFFMEKVLKWASIQAILELKNPRIIWCYWSEIRKIVINVI